MPYKPFFFLIYGRPIFFSLAEPCVDIFESSLNRPMKPSLTRCISSTDNEKRRWLTDKTKRLFVHGIVRCDRNALNSCRICGLQASPKRLWYHIRQHYARYFCYCGYNQVSRDTVLAHVKKCPNSKSSTIYEVDKESYKAFCYAMGWKTPPEFLPCVPTKIGNGAKVFKTMVTL